MPEEPNLLKIAWRDTQFIPWTRGPQVLLATALLKYIHGETPFLSWDLVIYSLAGVTICYPFALVWNWIYDAPRRELVRKTERVAVLDRTIEELAMAASDLKSRLLDNGPKVIIGYSSNTFDNCLYVHADKQITNFMVAPIETGRYLLLADRVNIVPSDVKIGTKIKFHFRRKGDDAKFNGFIEVFEDLCGVPTCPTEISLECSYWERNNYFKIRWIVLWDSLRYDTEQQWIPEIRPDPLSYERLNNHAASLALVVKRTNS